MVDVVALHIDANCEGDVHRLIKRAREGQEQEGKD
jgi:hypothetical protein